MPTRVRRTNTFSCLPFPSAVTRPVPFHPPPLFRPQIHGRAENLAENMPPEDPPTLFSLNYTSFSSCAAYHLRTRHAHDWTTAPHSLRSTATPSPNRSLLSRELLRSPLSELTRAIPFTFNPSVPPCVLTDRFVWLHRLPDPASHHRSPPPWCFLTRSSVVPS